MLKQAFEQSKELQEEVVPLSNVYSNRIDDLVDSSNKEDIINRYQSRNATCLQLPDISKNRVAGHSKIKEGVIRKNGVTGHSERGEGMEDMNGDMSEISFIDRGITRYN